MNFTIYLTALVCIFGIAHAMTVGSFVAVPKDDDTVKELAEFAVKEFLGPEFELTEIIRASKQTVAGELYLMLLRVARTTLDKTRLDQLCSVEVLYQSWLDKGRSLSSFKCASYPAKKK